MTMRALPIIALCAAAFLATPCLAQGTAPAPRAWTTADPEGQRGEFAFLGQRIGDPITKAFPDPKNQKDQFGMKLCRPINVMPDFLECADESLRKIVDGIPRLDYQGVEVSFVNMRYMKERFVGFTLAFDAKNFAAIAAVVKRQYGAPYHSEVVQWKDRVGFPFNTAVLSWNTPHGVMTLKERSVSPETGALELFESAAERRFDNLRFKQVVD